MMERRQSKRRRLSQQLNVYDRATEHYLGKAADLTARGLLVITEQPITVGANVEMRIDLPQSMFGRDHVDVDGSAVWRRKDANPRAFDVGFKFTSISPRDQEIIAQLIAVYSMVS